MASATPAVETGPLHWTSPAYFHVWRYGIGHSQLLLSSRSGATDYIDVLFEGVEFMQLNRGYQGLALDEDPTAQAQITTAGLRIPQLAINITGGSPRGITGGSPRELSTGSRTGLVICGNVSIIRQYRLPTTAPDAYESEYLVGRRSPRTQRLQ